MTGATPAGTALPAALVATVQYNCDVSDARHARDGALCTYLLGMREHCRWSTGAPPGAPLERAVVGAWISAREAIWDDLSDSAAAYRTLPLRGGIEVFDERAANAELRPHGLVYGGGVGRFGAPVFFLADRLRETSHAGVPIVYAGAELARGLVAPPAVSRERRVLVRTDAMRRWLWTRAEAGPARPHLPAWAELFATYGGTGPAAIERIVAEEAETLALHEIGEVLAGDQLGPDWEQMLAGLASRRNESVARAVRDLLADCLVTLPALVERRSNASWLFWFANFEGLRRVLAPRLGALEHERQPAHRAALLDACHLERERHRRIAEDLLARWRAAGAPAVNAALDALLAPAQPA